MGWLDAAAFALFVGLALLLAAQLVRHRSEGADRASAALHLTMAVGMAAMSQPRLDPVAPEVWMLTFVATAAGTLVLCVVGRRGRDDRPLTRPYDHLVASLLMVVAFARHGSRPGPGTHTMIDPASGAVTTMAGAGMGGHHAATSPLAQSIGAATTWPIWPLVGLGFVAYALWLTVGLVPARAAGGAADAACRCTGTRSERACGIVMAAAMGVMALTL